MSEKRKNGDDGDEQNDKIRLYATITFIVVIFVIGMPMWWKTTEVYRVSLPYDEIERLKDTPIKASLSVHLFTSKPDRVRLLTNELTQLFSTNAIFNVRFHALTLDLDELDHSHSPAALEAHALQHVTLAPGDFLFLEWPKLKEEVLVNSDRCAFISPQTSAVKIEQVLRTWILQEPRLRSILGSVTTIAGKTIRHNSPPPQPAYDVLVSVLNPAPRAQRVDWNVQLAAERYVAPFLEALAGLSNFTLKSQWKYQLEFENAERHVADAKNLRGRHFVLAEEQLPHTITALEKRLGNQVSNNPCIHLVVYAPTCELSPLHLYTRDGRRASNNGVDSFLSPKWGGIIIANPPEALCLKYNGTGEKVPVEINSHDVMKVALYLLRRIFELETSTPISGSILSDLDTIEPRTWEVDSYLRTGAIHLIHSAESTLNSLVQLLGGISYIVINDAVGEAIKTSHANILLAKSALVANDLPAATRYARHAFINAETAFFDPSLLALLYFPDEQKYAIYIPLFLPIMIPVVFSVSAIRRYLRRDAVDAEPKPKTE